jgi:RNA polymerase sigma-70 factor (sigma-E family)
MTADDPSFDECFDALRRAAYRAAYRLLGERDTADELAAEAVARAYSRWSAISGHAVPWTITTATNLALDLARRRARAHNARWQLVEQVAPDPRVEERLDLVRALQRLPRRQREVVALRYLGDLSEQQTAVALGIDVGTVKTHASRGLAALRRTMERV